MLRHRQAPYPTATGVIPPSVPDGGVSTVGVSLWWVGKALGGTVGDSPGALDR
jgi:hypothetical protein